MSLLFEATPRFLPLPLFFVSLLFFILHRYKARSHSPPTLASRLFEVAICIGPLYAISGAIGLVALSFLNQAVLYQKFLVAERIVADVAKLGIGLLMVYLVHPSSLRLLVAGTIPEVIGSRALRLHFIVYLLSVVSSFVLSFHAALMGSRLPPYIPAVVYLWATSLPIPLLLAIVVASPQRHLLTYMWFAFAATQTLGTITAILGLAAAIATDDDGYVVAECILMILWISSLTAILFVFSSVRRSPPVLPGRSPLRHVSVSSNLDGPRIAGSFETFRNLRDPFASHQSPSTSVPALSKPRILALKRDKSRVVRGRSSTQPLVQHARGGGSLASMFSGDPDETFLTAIVMQAFLDEGGDAGFQRGPRASAFHSRIRPSSETTVKPRCRSPETNIQTLVNTPVSSRAPSPTSTTPSLISHIPSFVTAPDTPDSALTGDTSPAEPSSPLGPPAFHRDVFSEGMQPPRNEDRS